MKPEAAAVSRKQRWVSSWGIRTFEETQLVEMPGNLGQRTVLLLPFLLFRISLGLSFFSWIMV